jgi:hypothetical protein
MTSTRWPRVARAAPVTSHTAVTAAAIEWAKASHWGALAAALRVRMWLATTAKEVAAQMANSPESSPDMRLLGCCHHARSSASVGSCGTLTLATVMNRATAKTAEAMAPTRAPGDVVAWVAGCVRVFVGDMVHSLWLVCVVLSLSLGAACRRRSRPRSSNQG